VGYKVNSEKAAQFRKWAAGIIESFTIKGYAMGAERWRCRKAHFAQAHQTDLSNAPSCRSQFDGKAFATV
jgi:hypothetical protein